jgi:hypothetical protein
MSSMIVLNISRCEKSKDVRALCSVFVLTLPGPRFAGSQSRHALSVVYRGSYAHI